MPPVPAILKDAQTTDARFDMSKLRDFRLHVNEVLASARLEHTHLTLEAMRRVCDPTDTEVHAKLDFIERKLVDNSPGRPRLHVEVLASVMAVIRMFQPETIVDVGCGEGMLIRALTNEPYITKLTGLEIDEREVKQAVALLGSAMTKSSGMAIDICRVDVTSRHSKQEYFGSDAIILSEVVEHIDDKDWIMEVFDLQPGILIVTTPNKEFNVLYDPGHLQPDGLRHPDHRFEFTRAEFAEWARKLAVSEGYRIDLLPIGPADILHGSASMMAVFQK